MAKTKYICTYFDYNFLSRGLALYNSIKRFHEDFVFFVLAFDEKTFEYLSKLKYDNLIPISVTDYNNYFNTNPDKYDDRKQYYFSATPNICIYLFKQFPDIDSLLYLDADVYIFSSLNPLYDEVENASIAYCPHRTHPMFNKLAKNHGKYNVGVNFFKNTEIAKTCLLDWKSDCENWYKGMPGYHLQYFSDQIFLDKWENKYSGINIIQNIGVNAAPWNAVNYIFSENNGDFYVNDKPLVIYHFSSVKKISNKKWNCNTIYYFASIKNTLRKIYKIYIEEIESYGISNDKIEIIKLNGGFGKKIFYFFMRIFLNENVNLKK
ncbi:glycosyltransferase [Bacteroidota bacterium]